jgi:two-component system chemotaxis response regulator CheY
LSARARPRCAFFHAGARFDTIPPVQLSRALIVEDSAAMRAFLRAALESSDLALEVIEAKSGFEALRILPRERFDFAFVDINMPDIHGLEVIRLMRASEAHASTPILVVSSEASPRDLERGLTLGADGWLKKPFTPEGLVAAVREVLVKRGLAT